MEREWKTYMHVQNQGRRTKQKKTTREHKNANSKIKPSLYKEREDNRKGKSKQLVVQIQWEEEKKSHGGVNRGVITAGRVRPVKKSHDVANDNHQPVTHKKN